MDKPQPNDPAHGHESVDHDDPTSAGLLSPDDQAPGTGILGDETVVRTAAGVDIPGIAPDAPPQPNGEAHPGPTPEE